jgi:hypothetical protein
MSENYFSDSKKQANTGLTTDNNLTSIGSVDNTEFLSQFTNKNMLSATPVVKKSAFLDSTFKPINMDSLLKFKEIGLGEKSNPINLSGGNPDPVTEETPWYQNGDTMQGYAGLANSLLGFATIGPQLKAYRQNLKESQYNLGRAKVNAERKDAMYANINAPMTNSKNNGVG